MGGQLICGGGRVLAFGEVVCVLNTAVCFFCSDPILDLYLLIHNIDGQMLHGDRNQQILSQLAAIPGIHLLASIDHLNAPLSECC